MVISSREMEAGGQGSAAAFLHNPICFFQALVPKADFPELVFARFHCSKEPRIILLEKQIL